MPDPLAIQNMPNLMQALSDPLHMQNLPNPQQLVQALATPSEALPAQTTIGAMAPAEMVSKPAIKLNDGTIHEGYTHAVALNKAQQDLVDNHGMSWEDAEDVPFDWGWTTSAGRFVPNEEALGIAKASGQIGEGYAGTTGGLESRNFHLETERLKANGR